MKLIAKTLKCGFPSSYSKAKKKGSKYMRKAGSEEDVKDYRYQGCQDPGFCMERQTSGCLAQIEK